MRANWRTLVVGCILLALLSAGCDSTHKSKPSASESAATGKAIGAGVRIAASRLPVGVFASITTVASPAVSGGLELLSKTFQLGPSGPLPVRATITLPLISAAPAGEAVVVATRESTEDPWTYLSATLAASRTSVTFTTTHFSIFSVLGYDLDQLVATFKTDFIDQVDGGATTTVVQPTCASSRQATADGYYKRVASHTDTVLDCLGMSGSTVELKVVNNRHYPLEVLHPHMTVVDPGPIDYGALASLSHFGSGGYTILAPGDQATFGAVLQPGHAGGVETQLDGLGQSLYQLQVGVSTLLEILGGFGVGSSSTAVNVANTMLGDTACLDSIDHGPAAMLASCFSPKDLVDSLGTKAIFLIPLMVVGPIVAFFESEFQALVNQFNNEDKEVIEVARAAEPVTPISVVVDAPCTVAAMALFLRKFSPTTTIERFACADGYALASASTAIGGGSGFVLALRSSPPGWVQLALSNIFLAPPSGMPASVFSEIQRELGSPGSADTVPAPITMLSVPLSDPTYSGIEPTVIAFSGDATNIISNITWSSWGQDTATGDGTWNDLGCVPDCASGTQTPYPATVELSSPHNGVFTHIVETTTGPQGFVQTFTYPYPWPTNASGGKSY